MVEEYKQLPFFALPDHIFRLCELAGLPQVSRVCDPHLVLHCSPLGGKEAASRAANEAVTLDPNDVGAEDVYATIAALGEVPNWRRMLITHYNCVDGNGGSGFLARLYYADGTPHPEVLLWASEEHYLCASMYMPRNPQAPAAQYDFARLFSLSSDSLICMAPGAARALALTGAYRVRPPERPWAEIRRPKGVEVDPNFYDEVNIRDVTWRAKVARYTQHAPSARALLATGRALITAQTVWCPQVLEVGTMAVRTLLQAHPGLIAQKCGQGGVPPGETPPAEHVMNQAPHPLAHLEGAAS